MGLAVLVSPSLLFVPKVTVLFLLVIKAIDYLAGLNEVSSVISVVGIIFFVVGCMLRGVSSGKYVVSIVKTEKLSRIVRK